MFQADAVEKPLTMKMDDAEMKPVSGQQCVNSVSRVKFLGEPEADSCAFPLDGWPVS